MLRTKRVEQGFTLIEIMIVIVILGILAWQLAPKIMGKPEEAKRLKAKMDIGSLETALKLYKLDNGVYPSTEQGLQALVEPPSIGQLPRKWREGGYLEKAKIPSERSRRQSSPPCTMSLPSLAVRQAHFSPSR